MRPHAIAISLLALISTASLTGCTSIGNVVPQNGPKMEQVYDQMGTEAAASSATSGDHPADLKTLRRQAAPVAGRGTPTPLARAVPDSYAGKTFRKLPNPELSVYIYPHLAGTDEAPIPGYSTVVSAYERDHYALPGDGANG
jgi:conjugative transfer region lipoprotein (TIGR03751 family)